MASGFKDLGGHILFALLLAIILALGSTPGERLDQAPQPYTTAPDLLAVTVIFRLAGQPVIAEVTPLVSGRITVTHGGPFALQTLDKAGDVTFQLAFQVLFDPPGLHGHSLEEVPLLFVVPGRNTAAILVTGPTGSNQWQAEE